MREGRASDRGAPLKLGVGGSLGKEEGMIQAEHRSWGQINERRARGCRPEREGLRGKR